MALPQAVQNETGRTITVTWYKKGTTTAEVITGATITGIIETPPGPSWTTRAVSGALAVSDGAGGEFTWTLDTTDTGSYGKFNIQFVATFGSGTVIKSIPVLWEVIRSPADPS